MSTYALSSAAEEDLFKIAEYTLENWGVNQTRKYMRQLDECMESLARRSGAFRERCFSR